MYNFTQEQIFMLFFIIGVIIGILFDIFRVIRKSIKVNDKITFIQDLIFIVLSGSLTVFSIIKINGGEVRFYLFLGIFFGIIIYLLTISSICVIILSVIVKLCIKILELPIYFIRKIIHYAKIVRKKDF